MSLRSESLLVGSGALMAFVKYVLYLTPATLLLNLSCNNPSCHSEAQRAEESLRTFQAPVTSSPAREGRGGSVR